MRGWLHRNIGGGEKSIYPCIFSALEYRYGGLKILIHSYSLNTWRISANNLGFAAYRNPHESNPVASEELLMANTFPKTSHIINERYRTSSISHPRYCWIPQKCVITASRPVTCLRDDCAKGLGRLISFHSSEGCDDTRVTGESVLGFLIFRDR